MAHVDVNWNYFFQLEKTVPGMFYQSKAIFKELYGHSYIVEERSES